MTASNAQEPSYVFGGERNNEARQVIHKYLTTNSLSVEQAASDLLETIRVPTSQPSQGKKSDARAWLLSLEVYYACFEPPTASGTDPDAALHRLAELVKAMLSNPESQEVIPEASTNNMTLAWDFAIATSEMWNFAPRTLNAGQWRNLLAFLAISWAQKAFERPLDGIWLMRQALETEQQSQSDEPPRDIAAALAFITYAGKLMFQSSKVWDYNRPGDTLSGNPAVPGPLLKQQAQSSGIEVPNGYSKARWAFWKSRFERIAQEAAERGDAKETSQIAQAAVKAMAEIEEQIS